MSDDFDRAARTLDDGTDAGGYLVPPAILEWAVPDCWCARCDPRSRMNLCPDCGDKRCPRATHHAHDCTGSISPRKIRAVYRFPADYLDPPTIHLTWRRRLRMWLRRAWSMRPRVHLGPCDHTDC